MVQSRRVVGEPPKLQGPSEDAGAGAHVRHIQQSNEQAEKSQQPVPEETSEQAKNHKQEESQKPASKKANEQAKILDDKEEFHDAEDSPSPAPEAKQTDPNAQNKALPSSPATPTSDGARKPDRNRLLRYFRKGEIVELERFNGSHLRKSTRPGARVGFPLDDKIQQAKPITQWLVRHDGEVEDWELRGTFWTYREPEVDSVSESGYDGSLMDLWSPAATMLAGGLGTIYGRSGSFTTKLRRRSRCPMSRDGEEDDAEAIFSGAEQP